MEPLTTFNDISQISQSYSFVFIFTLNNQQVQRLLVGIYGRDVM